MRGSDWSLAFFMLVTGSINTISTKWADTVSAPGINNSPPHVFNHPFFQASGMFLGEFLCFVAFKYAVWNVKRTGGDLTPLQAKPFNPIIFLLPACCDMTGTSLMYLGLTMTYASVFQMLRGSVVIFTAIFSVLFLGRKLHPFHWFGVALVLVGAAIVGVASVIGGGSSGDASNPMLGNILICSAQVIVAAQMCIEEKFVGGYNVPALQAVGWEGIFGFCVLNCFLVLFYHLPGDDVGGRFENALDALYQIGNSWEISVALVGNIMSIAFFNYFGISVTKVMSASHRMVFDSVRTFVIWGFSLIIGWEEFSFLQIIGFFILLSGTCVFNELFRVPYFAYPERLVDVEDGDANPLHKKLLFESDDEVVQADIKPKSNANLRNQYYRMLNVQFNDLNGLRLST
eukprot:GFYU01007002.1.p1 GENE.GFYU01007002.1~~GFYU01007002.1.p1  ORF type:complete len:401 (-),score=118.10 GFYU01007002.1:293-1495(-)